MPGTSLAVPYGPARDEYSDWSNNALRDAVHAGKACADRDPNAFWELIDSEKPPADQARRDVELEYARSLCTNPITGAVCPVLAQCLALENRITRGPERYGVLAGMPGWERTWLLNRRRRAV